MENQMPQEDQQSRDSSISLEDGGPVPRINRSDLYTARQPPREAYGPMTAEPFFMMPLDLPSTITAEGPIAGTYPLNDSDDSSSLSVLRLERYLAEEHCHERLPLGVPPLGVNKATVKRYLPEIMQTMNSDASQAEGTRGTITDCDERGCRESASPSTSTASDTSPEPLRAHDSSDTDSALLPLASFSNHYMAPGLVGLGQIDEALSKPERAPASSESHLIGSSTLEGDLETGHILIRHRMRGFEGQNRWRVGKQTRVRRTVRRRRRSEELK
ncbi:hypothetical protein V8C42DRAFT_83355 [Trichoderma barbatum]